MAAASWIRTLLEKRGVRFEERHHREAYTAQEVAQCEHISGHRLAKVVLVIADGKPIELILPASRKVDMDRLRRVLRSHFVRLASEAEIERIFNDVEAGAVPALRHWRDVEVLMDRDMEVEGEIMIQAGTHEDAICLDYHDWFDIVSPRIAAFSRLEPAMA
jgi:Ala-tRNA(Pro) deacylase